MKTIEDIKALYKSNDIPTMYLEEAISEGMACKSIYLDRLELTKENDYRIVLPLPQDIGELRYAKRLLNLMQSFEAFEIIDFQYLMVGKNKVKTTKMITKYWKELHNRDALISVQMAIHDMRRNNSRDYKEVDLDNLQNFLIAWGDYTKNGLVAVVSANPWDYLVLSGGDDDREFCTYTSCVHPYNGGGRYFNTVLCYLNSPSVFVGYTANANNLDKKIGRTMLYLGGFTTVSSCRTYGSISEGALIALRDYCQMKLSIGNQLVFEGLGGNYSWTIKGGSIGKNEAFTFNGSPYIDASCGVVTVERDKQLEKCVMNDGMCLECGDSLNGSEQYGMCVDCGGDSHKCYNCGRRVNEDDCRYYNDYIYCENCFNDDFSYCEDCDEWYPNDDMYRVGSGRHERYVCYSCRNNNYRECDECAEWFDIDEMIEIGDGKYVCPRCFEDFKECPECNEYFKMADMKEVNDDLLCNECAKNWKKCVECGDMVEKNSMHLDICQCCIEAREEKVCCG